MVYLSIALCCVLIVASVSMPNTRSKRRRLILQRVAIFAALGVLTIEAITNAGLRWLNVGVVVFVVAMLAVGSIWERRRHTRAAIPPR